MEMRGSSPRMTEVWIYISIVNTVLDTLLSG